MLLFLARLWFEGQRPAKPLRPGVRLSDLFDPWNAATLCRLEQEFDFHRIKREDDAAIFCTVEDT